MKFTRLLIVFLSGLVVIAGLFLRKNSPADDNLPPEKFWQMLAIDTVKHSRDEARLHLNNPVFDKVINDQVEKIASTGATHIAISTPYDEEFIPYMKRWISAARQYGLKVWFRGNFSGWEGWFGYPRISREEHLVKLKEFILGHGQLFESGDIFTSCTECENGGPGDPRSRDVAGFRRFLIDEYQTAREAFRLVDKNVTANYYPMNGDVAKLVMDPATTQALGGVAVIDHYVISADIMEQSVNELAELSGGQIVIGEFGAPIPDIHGQLNDEEQANWINQTLAVLANNKNVIGINYWTGFGGSTRLWLANGEATPAVALVQYYFQLMRPKK